ncbi:hypothetical protein LI90_2424 [Carbonactinospora thermoautotrophica]|uniref:GAF domain-containing protein n=1 Tax=Carbonactinospora thermoautotrophica TaxID=1469144 RepID=A0A132MUH6_9ACTN|nr:GAF domain-containing protein [Carbonactinospora thermoautotrophica]KWX01396.1 hypothetical protein LI90_2424 [Carbonactinospora thermoautotrophica]
MDALTGTQSGSYGAPYESQRTRRLRSLGLNDPSPDEAFDRFAHLAVSITNAPIALVNFVNDERQMFRGVYVPPPDTVEDPDGHGWTDRGIVFDLPAREMPLSHGFCPHVVAQRAPLALDDVLAYPRFAGNPVVNELGVRAYLGVPLVDDDGTVIGTVCALDREPRAWGRQRLHAMQRLAEALLSEIRLRDNLLTQQQETLVAFDRLPFPVMLTDGLEHWVRYVNLEHVAAFGEPAAHLPGPQALPHLSMVGLFNVMADVYRTGRPALLSQVRIVPGNHGGRQIDQYFSFCCTPVRLPHTGQVSGVLTVGLDLTTQNRTEEELSTLASTLAERLQWSGRGGTAEAMPLLPGGFPS